MLAAAGAAARAADHLSAGRRGEIGGPGAANRGACNRSGRCPRRRARSPATLTNTAASSAIAPRRRRGGARGGSACATMRAQRIANWRWTESADRISVPRQLAREPAALPAAAAALIERRTVQTGNARFERLHVMPVRRAPPLRRASAEGLGGLRVAALKLEPCGCRMPDFAACDGRLPAAAD